MRGRIVKMVKKWWIIALVFVLALTLTSCSKKNGVTNQGVLSKCDNPNFAYIDMTVEPSTQGGVYNVYAYPQAINPGSIVRIGIDDASGNFRILTDQVALNPGVKSYVGQVTDADFSSFDQIAIQSYPQSPAVCAFQDECTGLNAQCELYAPSDLLGQTSLNNR